MRSATLPRASGLILALVALAAIIGCGEAPAPERVYPKSEREVRRTLLSIKSLPPIFGNTPVETRVTDHWDDTIVWTASRQAKPLLRFVAHVEATDPRRTRLTLEVLGPTNAEDDPITRRLADNPSIRTLYLAAVAEQIDATFEGRKFDGSALSDELTAANAANVGNLMQRFDEVAADHERRNAENVARAYELEAAGGWAPQD